MRTVVLGVAVLIGCGDDPQGPALASEAHVELVRAHCEKAFECEVAYSPNQHLTDFRQVFKGSAAECETMWTMSSADLASLDEAVSAQHIAYDRGASGRCFDDVASTSCNDWFNYDGFVTRPGSCEGMFKGRVSLGAACQLSFECVAGWCMDGTCVNP